MQSLFERALEPSFEQMPMPIRELHRPPGKTLFDGVAQIDDAANVLAAVAARLFRFPRAGRDVPVEVTSEPRANHEVWRRTFGGKGFSSVVALDAHTRRL